MGTLDEIMKTWEHLITLVKQPENDAEFTELLQIIADLATIVGENENHPMFYLLDYLGMLASNYQGDYCPDVTHADLLNFIMDQRSLSKNDFPEIDNIDDVLGGENLTSVQIQALSQRFGLNSEVFSNGGETWQ